MTININTYEFIQKIQAIREVSRKISHLVNFFSKNFVVVHSSNNVEKPIDMRIAAIDGSLYKEEKSFITSIIVSGYVYVFGRSKKSTYTVPVTIEPDIFPPSYSSLASTIKMKILEYKLALYTLVQFEEVLGEHLDYILLDGSITFPETLPGNLPQSVKNLYENYKREATYLFRKAEKYKVGVISISKDPYTVKYLRSLKRLKKGIRIPKSYVEVSNILKKIDEYYIDLLGEERYFNPDNPASLPERYLVKKAFEKVLKESRESFAFIRTLSTEVTAGLRDILIEIEPLQDNTIGFYCFSPKRTLSDIKPLFVEFGGWLDHDKVINDIVHLFYFSATGYPTPLLMAHKIVKLTARKAKYILRYIKLMSEKEGFSFNEFLVDKFREGEFL